MQCYGFDCTPLYILRRTTSSTYYYIRRGLSSCQAILGELAKKHDPASLISCRWRTLVKGGTRSIWALISECHTWKSELPSDDCSKNSKTPPSSMQRICATQLLTPPRHGYKPSPSAGISYFEQRSLQPGEIISTSVFYIIIAIGESVTNVKKIQWKDSIIDKSEKLLAYRGSQCSGRVSRLPRRR